MNEIEVPLKVTGIGAIKKELRDLKGELANATDPEQIAKLSQKAGQLKDQLADANEQVAIFASGSKFEQVSNGLGSIKDSIMNLDFAEAGNKAKMLTSALKGINPAEFATQFKGFGQVILSLGSAVGVAMKQFIAFGVSLLANPIFLLVAAIVAIVAAIVLLLYKMGILKKIFDTLMIPINAIIQGFKDLTDWLGLTSYAAEENAAKTAAANEAVIESSKKRQDAVVGALDFEIKMAQLRGEETLSMELNRSRKIQDYSKTRLQSAKTAYQAELKLGVDADKEKLKKLKQQIDDERKAITEQVRDRQYIVEQDRQEKIKAANKEAEDEKKDAEARRKAAIDAAKKRADDAKKFAENRLAAARLIRDLEINEIKNDADREIVSTQEKYARLIEDVKKNENYTKDEKLRLQKLYQKELENTLAKQEQVEIDAEKAKQQKLLDLIKANQEAQQQAEEDFYEQYRVQVMTEQQREVDGVNSKYFQLIAKAEQYGLDTKKLKEQQEKEIADINKKYSDAAIKLKEEEEKKKRDAQLQTANDALTIAEDSTKAIQAVGDIAFQAKMAKVKKGSKEEEELAKKQFKFNKALQLAGAIVDAGKAITASLASAPLATVAGPNPIGIANLIATAAISAANIAKIAATQFTSTASSSGQQPSIPSASSTSTTNATPSASLFGQNNNLNNVTSPTEQQQNTQITVKAVVSETELTKTQNKVLKINQNATL